MPQAARTRPRLYSSDAHFSGSFGWRLCQGRMDALVPPGFVSVEKAQSLETLISAPRDLASSSGSCSQYSTLSLARLETRTKERSTRASQWVMKPVGAMKVYFQT